MQAALRYDRYSAQPITHYVEQPDDIRKLFNTVAYEKCNYEYSLKYLVSLYFHF